jgi:hypothetical protein
MKKLLGAAFFTVSVFGFVLDLLLLNHPHLGRGLVWPLLMGAMAAGTLAGRIKRTRLCLEDLLQQLRNFWRHVDHDQFPCFILSQWGAINIPIFGVRA